MSAKAINTTYDASKILHVTQGDEEGIGLEVFFKSVVLFTQKQCDLIVLYAGKRACEKTLRSIEIPFELLDSAINLGSCTINVRWCDDSAFNAIEAAVTSVKKGDILFTLPAAKTSFPKGSPGHTAFLRNHYKRELGMFFHGNQVRVLLLSDHVPLNKVRSSLSSDFIFKLVSRCLDGAKNFLNEHPQQISFSGINPHAGEGGVLGDDLDLFLPALKKLNSSFKDIQFNGPLSGDILFHSANSEHWLVYAHHDQGLAPFKATRGFIGANITLGLDFLRLSVDHGTALDKFGKDSANYMGCLYCLQLAFKSMVKQ